MTRCSQDPITPGAALVPLITDVVIDEAGALANARWRPGPQTNLVHAEPGCGATTLWRKLVREGRHVDIEFTAVSSEGPAQPFALPAGIRALATASASLIAATPRYCAVLDTDITTALDDAALSDLCRVIEAFGGQSVVFCTPAVFHRLAVLRAERWQLTREYAQSRLSKWPGGG